MINMATMQEYTNDDLWLTLSIFTAKQGQKWETARTKAFMEFCKFWHKDGRYSNLNEDMNICQYKRSKSFFDSCPRLSSYFQNFMYLFESHWANCNHIHVKPPGPEGTKIYSTIQVT